MHVLERRARDTETRNAVAVAAMMERLFIYQDYYSQSPATAEAYNNFVKRGLEHRGVSQRGIQSLVHAANTSVAVMQHDLRELLSD